MNLSNYQDKAMETAIYPNIGYNIAYPTLGLAGEAGEIANKVKKIYRDNDGLISPDVRKDLKKELGDVLWYLAIVATEAGLDLDDIANANLQKLAQRKVDNTLQGSGDNR